MHAQKLVHRDVNPRNVRLADDGHAKLIDFGALATFGVARDVVGAPSCLAPEALRGGVLDARSDLFSLGVVAYFALTGKAPYAIAGLNDAERAWQKPVVPARELVPAMPPALDELVLALLGLDPLARPASAEDVIDRLDAITGRRDDPVSAIAESHLASAPFVGRAPEQTKLEPLLAQLTTGRGAVLAVEGEIGIGKTRLLSELRIDAQLAGLTCLWLDGSSQAARDSLLRRLLRGLLEVAPTETRRSPLFSCEPLAALRAQLDAHDDEGLAKLDRVRTQAALAALVLDVARLRPLLIAIDDAHLLRAESAGVLLMIAHGALDVPLLLAAAHLPGQGSPAVQQLTYMGLTLLLGALDETAVEQLVHGMFGDVPHRARLAQRLASTSRGHPGRLHAQLRDLLSRQIVRQVAGAWVLPAQLDEVAMPSQSQALATVRLERLGETARAILRTLALHAGPLPDAVFFRMSPHEEPRRVLDALATLTAEQLVEGGSADHTLRNEALRERLLAPLSSSERTRMHLAIAQALRALAPERVAELSEAVTTELSLQDVLHGIAIGYHLLEAGDVAQGTCLLRNGAIELTVRGEGLTAAAPLLESAVARLRALGRPKPSYAAPLALPTLAGMYSDARLSYRYGDQALEVLCDLSGLSLARRLRPYLGALALYIGLFAGVMYFVCFPGRRATNRFRELLLALMGLGSAVLSVCCVAQDRERALRVGERLAPLGDFPRRHPVRIVQEFQRALLTYAEGDYAAAHALARPVLEYVRAEESQKTLPPRARMQIEAGILTMYGHLDGMRTDGSAEATLRALAALRVSNVPQLLASARASLHGHRGERDALSHVVDELDQLAASSNTIWRSDMSLLRMLWSSYLLCEDVTALKRAAQQLQPLTSDLPSLARLRDILDGCYLCERGMAEDALLRHRSRFEAAKQLTGVRALQELGAYARILRKAGAPREALAICEEAMSRMTERDRGFTVITFLVHTEHALAHAALAESARAAELADAVLAAQAGHDNPLLHALAHGVRAQVALATEDVARFDLELAGMRDWVRRTENPALVAQVQRLAERRRARAGAAVHGPLPGSNEAFETEIV